MNTSKTRAAGKARRQQEKEAEDAAAAKRLEEERLKAQQREEQKKERDAERKREEEEAKRQRATGEKAADADDVEMTDKPDENINDHLNDINSGGVNTEGAAAEEPNEEAEETRVEGSSPPKKKKKKDKKKSSKEKSKDKEGEPKETEKEGVASVLKKGRFSTEGVEAAKKKEGEEKKRSEEAAAAARAKAAELEELREERKTHIHTHRRSVVECSFVCMQEDELQRFNELPMAVRTILKNMQKVDKWACLEPVEVGDGEKIYEPSEVSFDHTELGTHVMHTGGTKAFELRRPKKGKKQDDDGDIDDWVKPEIYFTVAFSCDKDPHKILERIGGEWAKVGGNKLWLKEIASFSTMTAFTMFHVRNNNSYETIAAELKRIFEEAKEKAAEDSIDTYYEYQYAEIPQMGIRKQVPRVDGMDTSIFQGWDGRRTDMRKTLQIEVEEEAVQMIHSLVEKAKMEKLFEKYFGRRVKVTLVLDNKGGRRKGKQVQQKVDLAAMASFCRKHVNYQSCTRVDGIRGILDLDKEVPFYSVTDRSRAVGKMSLRMVMYSRFTMSDGHSLFWEVHQAAPMGAVDVVVPNAEEAERMLIMMNRNFAAYATNYLIKVSKMDEEFVGRLIRATVDPSLVNTIGECKWQEKDWVLTTPEDEENEKVKAIEEAAWYNDEFGDHMFDTSKKEKTKYASQEALDELNCDHTYKSVHMKKGNYVGSPDAPAFQVGGKSVECIDVDDDESVEAEETDLEKMSHAELVKLLKAHKLSSKKKGSPPSDEKRSGSGRSVEADESSESSFGSSSSSSGSSSSDEKMEETSPPSDGGSTAACKPGPGE